MGQVRSYFINRVPQYISSKRTSSSSWYGSTHLHFCTYVSSLLHPSLYFFRIHWNIHHTCGWRHVNTYTLQFLLVIDLILALTFDSVMLELLIGLLPSHAQLVGLYRKTTNGSQDLFYSFNTFRSNQFTTS